MAYRVTLEVPDDEMIKPWYGIFERGCCDGCPNSYHDADKNLTICCLIWRALPVGYDHDQHPWELCSIKSVKHIDKKVPMRIGQHKWLRPDREE